MKFRIEKKYLAWAFTAFLTFGACLGLYYLIFYSSSLHNGIQKAIGITMPVIDGFLLAYILTPIVNLIEKKLLDPFFIRHFTSNGKLTKKQKTRIRSCSILMTIFCVLLLLTGFFRLVIPQIIRSIQSIIFQFPFYVRNLSDFTMNFLINYPELEDFVTEMFDTYSTELTDWINNGVVPQINGVIKTLSVSVYNFVVGIWNFIIGFILSIYILASKEKFAGQAKKIVYAFFEEKNANEIINDFRFTHKTFIGFIGGKIVDSIIIGIICFIVSSLIHLPYAMLISVIVGVTNVIPFFGPYLGAIPSALLILLVNPIQSVYFLIMILCIQQFDGNFLGPKILGNSTGLSGFWVIFAVTVFGGFFGVIGMIAGVPVFAVVYAWVNRMVVRRLNRKKLPAETKPYRRVERIEEGVLYQLPSDNNDENVISKMLHRFFAKNKNEDEPAEYEESAFGEGASEEIDEKKE